MKPLTGKQELFCLAYAEHRNATRAMREAGYTCAEGSMASMGVKNLMKPGIKARLDELTKGKIDQLNITPLMVLEKIWSIADVDPAEAYNADGSFKSIHDIPIEVRKAISSIDVYKDFTEGVEIGETKRIKFCSREKMIELMGKHMALFQEHINVNNTNVNIELDASNPIVQKVLNTLTQERLNVRDVTPIKLKSVEDDEK